MHSAHDIRSPGIVGKPPIAKGAPLSVRFFLFAYRWIATPYLGFLISLICLFVTLDQLGLLRDGYREGLASHDYSRAVPPGFACIAFGAFGVVALIVRRRLRQQGAKS
jgi:hypothetical protein